MVNTSNVNTTLKERGDTKQNIKSKERRRQRSIEAAERHSRWRSLTLEEQLKELELRPGRSVKQRARIARQIVIRDLYKDYGDKVVKTEHKIKESEKVRVSYEIKLLLPSTMDSLISGDNVKVLAAKEDKISVVIQDVVLAEHLINLGLARVDKTRKVHT